MPVGVSEGHVPFQQRRHHILRDGLFVSKAIAYNGGIGNRVKIYGVIAGATLLGVLLAFSPIDPMKALYWAAVLNGILAAPLMVVMMLISSNGRIMGRLAISWRLRVAGWIATAAMAAASVGLFVTL